MVKQAKGMAGERNISVNRADSEITLEVQQVDPRGSFWLFVTCQALEICLEGIISRFDTMEFCFPEMELQSIFELQYFDR